MAGEQAEQLKRFAPPWTRPLDGGLLVRRAAALTIDGTITLPLALLLLLPSVWMQAGSPALNFLYYFVATGVFGRTLGKQLMGLEVVCQRGGGAPGLIRAFSRYAPLSLPVVVATATPGASVAMLLGLVFWPFLIADVVLGLVVLGARGSSLHDLLGDTLVVRRK